MAKVAIIGAGHVGVTYAAGLAELGHRVHVVDVDARRLALLRRGRVWFHEPGLTDLLQRGMRRGRIRFTSSHAEALRSVEFVFVCVPTPTTPDGSLDDSALRSAFHAIREHAGNPPPVVVNKSTVPVGTVDMAATVFGDAPIQIVSNPEFLAEGRAVADFFHPHRIVIGARDVRAARAVAKLFRPLRTKVVLTDPATAEIAKLAANTFLATKISFMNAFARIAEHVGADIDDLARALSLDPRIGPGHLRAGLGFGGSCLPKDVAAVEHLARKVAAPYELFAAVSTINREQRTRIIDHLLATNGSLDGTRVAVLGLSFKPDTDDLRESPAVALISDLVAHKARVSVYDPVVRARVAGARRARTVLAAARSAEAIVIATDWQEFYKLDLAALRSVMRGRIFVDGRGIYDPRRVQEAGFEYFGYGRRGVGMRSKRE